MSEPRQWLVTLRPMAGTPEWSRDAAVETIVEATELDLVRLVADLEALGLEVGVSLLTVEPQSQLLS